MARKRRPPRPGALADQAPWRILKTIVLLQSAYYASAIILIVFSVLVAGKELKPGLLLDWTTIRADSTVGWMMAMIWVLNGLISVIFILIFVARSKLVPDYALTVHLLHLLFSSVYTHSIPKTLFWWGVQVFSVTFMTILGVWSCQWRELKPINFGFSNSGTSSSQTTTADDQGVGFPRGQGGTYELLDRGTPV
ncbi:hypothetical protein BT63DRAFT_427611 [Microthyrium microscopicum]|uniref:Integral membrane protein n=1 Tax=Microthyrium microscopicum TaxID=703497 RepID=A0A6A6U4K8_9PEZI|nr:hypothetical protein BT63DRAFT_427611 [Microthyrium microscopicum]